MASLRIPTQKPTRGAKSQRLESPAVKARRVENVNKLRDVIFPNAHGWNGKSTYDALAAQMQNALEETLTLILTAGMSLNVAELKLPTLPDHYSVRTPRLDPWRGTYAILDILDDPPDSDKSHWFTFLYRLYPPDESEPKRLMLCRMKENTMGVQGEELLWPAKDSVPVPPPYGTVALLKTRHTTDLKSFCIDATLIEAGRRTLDLTCKLPKELTAMVLQYWCD